jgi:hypothetical protein
MSDLRADLAIAEMAILRWYRAHKAAKYESDRAYFDAKCELIKLGEGIEATRRGEGLSTSCGVGDVDSR